MGVHISDHFTYRKIFSVVIFPIIMMIFTSLYSIVDGIFIANFANGSSFAAVNLIFPLIMIVGSIGFMMGSGGTALVSKLLGERKEIEANKAFSLITYATIVVGIIFSIIGFFLVEPIVKALDGASANSSEEMVKEATTYGRILILAQSLFMLQNMFQSFFMVAEKSKLGFIFTIAGGVTNMIFDALFIALFKWGVVGAALATISGYIVAGIGPVIYFIVKKDGIIHLGTAKFNIGVIAKSAYNGMSEFISNISSNVVAIFFNAQLLIAYGEKGVSAYGIVMYVCFVFMAIFIGYSIGVAPIVGYNFGSKNNIELQNVLKKSLIIVAITGVAMVTLSSLMARPLSMIFANGDEELLNLATKAMRIFSLVYIASGFCLFLSSFFTALNNGTISTIISVLRTAAFHIGFLYLLPIFLGSDGIWWALVIGDITACLFDFMILILYRNKYGY